MSFEVRQDGAFIDIYNKEKDIALARVPAINSDSGLDEFYILDGDWSPISYDNSDEVEIPTPYMDIEQALDDFEYMTETIPEDIIKDFKLKIKDSNTLINSRKVSENMERKTKNSDRSELFFLNRDGGFLSLLHAPTGYQLNFSPAHETASGEDEFSITTEDFEPIENYEVLANTFTTDFSEALSEFESLVGNIPQSTISDFVNKAFMETSKVREQYVVVNEDGKVLSFVDENNLDFLDTVDDVDGGYAKAYKFDSIREAKEAMDRVDLVEPFEVLPVSEAFAFVNETSDRHKYYDDNDPRLENGVVVIDEDGKVLTYTGNGGTYDFLDTVDDIDGGFSRAVIFRDEEQAYNAQSTFPEGHTYEFAPVSEAFAFVNETSAKEEYVVIDDDGKVLSNYYENHEYTTGFIDTVDDPDGGYAKAVKFSSPAEAESKLKGWNMSDIPHGVLTVDEAFAFVNE